MKKKIQLTTFQIGTRRARLFKIILEHATAEAS